MYMWEKKVEVMHEPHCDIMPEDLRMYIPVCRDMLREKYERIARWRSENYEFERISIKNCDRCKVR